MRARTVVVAAVAAVVACVPATGAAAAERGPVTVKGVDGAGPSAYDRVRLIKSGPSRAKHVFVLMPGTSAGAGNTALVGNEIAKRLPGWQVWSISRRETLLEDHATLDGLVAGTVTPQRAFDYYLGWLTDQSITDHVRIPADADVAFARDWGMKVTIGDLHRVIKAARRGGRTVVLGGHSLGGSIATAYATWDFHGRAGARDLAGLVLIDGGSSRAGSRLTTAAEARAALAANAAKSPFLDLSGAGVPWSVGVFGELGGALARLEPTAPSRFWAWPLLPTALKAPVAPTTRAQFGYAIDSQTSPPQFALAQVHAGHLADSGDPRDWVDGELVTVDRAARVFTNPILGGTSWFHPVRLTTDAGAVAGGVRNPAQRVLGVRAWHGDRVELPIYAYETALGAGRVIKGARALARRSHVPRRDRVFVDRSAEESHLDPLADTPATNHFLKTIVPFLKTIR
jgi:hypothetical protein